MTLSLPNTVVRYAQTPSFTEASIPNAMLEDHSTKPNCWGLIAIEQGSLSYTRVGHAPVRLTPDTPGVILPDELHKIAPIGPVRFHVEFYRDPDAAEDHGNAGKAAR